MSRPDQLDERPIGAGLLLWNMKGEALIALDTESLQYNLYDLGVVPPGISITDFTEKCFRSDSGFSGELVIENMLTFVRSPTSEHDCRTYHVLLGEIDYTRPIRVGSLLLDWKRLSSLPLEHCHPAFASELRYYRRYEHGTSKA